MTITLDVAIMIATASVTATAIWIVEEMTTVVPFYKQRIHCNIGSKGVISPVNPGEDQVQRCQSLPGFLRARCRQV